MGAGKWGYFASGMVGAQQHPFTHRQACPMMCTLAVAAAPPAVAEVAEGEEGELPPDTAGEDQPAGAAAEQEARPISFLGYRQVTQMSTDIAQRRGELWAPMHADRWLVRGGLADWNVAWFSSMSEQHIN